MRWYQGWSINKYQLVAVVVIPVTSFLLYAWFIRWHNSHSPFHRIEVDPTITAAAPADPAARLNELVHTYRDGSFRVRLAEDVRFGEGTRLSYDQSEVVWSRAGGVERFDEMGVRKGYLAGQTAIDSGGTSGAKSFCSWQIAAASDTAVTTCHPDVEFFDATILYSVIRELLGSPEQEAPATKVDFYGYMTGADEQGECFSLSVGFVTQPTGVLCLTSKGVPLAIEGDLQRGYYHVSLRATDVGPSPTADELTRQVVAFPSDSIDYTKATIPLAQMTLPSTALVNSFTGR